MRTFSFKMAGLRVGENSEVNLGMVPGEQHQRSNFSRTGGDHGGPWSSRLTGSERNTNHS